MAATLSTQRTLIYNRMGFLSTQLILHAVWIYLWCYNSFVKQRAICYMVGAAERVWDYHGPHVGQPFIRFLLS